MDEMTLTIIVSMLLGVNLIVTLWVIRRLHQVTHAHRQARQELTQAVSDLQQVCAHLSVHLADAAQRPKSAAAPLASGGVMNDRLLEQAIRMARAGADAEQLVLSYGLSQGEAELLLLLHRRSD